MTTNTIERTIRKGHKLLKLVWHPRPYKPWFGYFKAYERDLKTKRSYNGFTDIGGWPSNKPLAMSYAGKDSRVLTHKWLPEITMLEIEILEEARDEI